MSVGTSKRRHKTLIVKKDTKTHKPTRHRKKQPRKLKCNTRGCYKCKIHENDYGRDANLLQCTRCHLCVHVSCHQPSLEHIGHQFRNDWECDSCKSCVHCGEDDREDELIFCDACDRGYHTTCIDMTFVPEGDWKCSDCTVSKPYMPPARVRVHGNTFYIQHDRPQPGSRSQIEVPVEDNVPNSIVEKLRKAHEDTLKLKQDDDVLLSIIHSEGIPSILELKRIKLLTKQNEDSVADITQKILNIRRSFPHILNIEAAHALSLCDSDQNGVIKRLSEEPYFLHQVRKVIAQQTTTLTHVKVQKSKSAPVVVSDSETQNSHTDEEFVPMEQIKPIKKKHSKKNRKEKRTASRLTLNDAMTDTDKMRGWSEARKNAFKKIEDKPNTYYYRFNKPGEEQRNGPWTEDEKKLFMRRLKEVKHDSGNPQWGIFSQAIPGRVGYQCSNFYRLLISKGDIKDDKYGVNEDGEMFYKVKDLKRKKEPKKGLKRKRNEETDESEEKVES